MGSKNFIIVSQVYVLAFAYLLCQCKHARRSLAIIVSCPVITTKSGGVTSIYTKKIMQIFSIPNFFYFSLSFILFSTGICMVYITFHGFGLDTVLHHTSLRQPSPVSLTSFFHLFLSSTRPAYSQDFTLNILVCHELSILTVRLVRLILCSIFSAYIVSFNSTFAPFFFFIQFRFIYFIFVGLSERFIFKGILFNVYANRTSLTQYLNSK